MSQVTPIERARAAYGGDIPDWVEGLARACAETSQNRVAKRMGVSAALISNVIAGKYPGDMARVEDLYRGAFEAQTVDCPAMGMMPLDECRHWRAKSRKLSNANTRNVTMFRACNRCPINKGGGDGDTDG